MAYFFLSKFAIDKVYTLGIYYVYAGCIHFVYVKAVVVGALVTITESYKAINSKSATVSFPRLNFSRFTVLLQQSHIDK